jgi:ABC-type transport system involved in multi-copper enzyme maturation permease subunit
MLAATPISSLAIVLGKLVSALAWVLLLLLASIPVTALVFTFGGVSPDDVVRAYVVLLVMTVAFGAIGLFVSSFVRRTPAATVITFAVVGTLTLGTFFVHDVWSGLAGSTPLFLFRTTDGRAAFADKDGFGAGARPPEALLYLNPFVAQLDVACGTETGFGVSCQMISEVTDDGGALFDGGVGQFGMTRDSFWPRSLVAVAVVALLLIVLTVQLVSPTRRWRLRRPRRRRPEGSDA